VVSVYARYRPTTFVSYNSVQLLTYPLLFSYRIGQDAATFVPTSTASISADDMWPKYASMTETEFRAKFHTQDMGRDGNCLFYAMSQTKHSARKHWRNSVKRRLLEYLDDLIKNSTVFRESSGFGMSELVGEVESTRHILQCDNEYGTTAHICLFERVFNYGVYIWKHPDCMWHGRDLSDPTDADAKKYRNIRTPQNCSGDPDGIAHFLYSGNNHYDLLLPNRYFIDEDASSMTSTTPYLTRRKSITTSTPSTLGTLTPMLPPRTLPASVIDIQDLPTSSAESAVESGEEFDLHTRRFSHSSQSSTGTPMSMSQQDETKSVNSDKRGSKKGGVSQLEYNRRLTAFDPIEECYTFFNQRCYCCDEGCMSVIDPMDCGTATELYSDKISEPYYVWQQCRRVVAAFRRRRERSNWVLEKLRSFFRRSESDTPSKPTFKYVVHYRTSTVGSSDQMAVDVCERAWCLLYGISRGLLWKKKRLISADLNAYSTERDYNAATSAIFEESNKSEKPLSPKEMECVSFIRSYCERNGEYMPHESKIRIAFRRNHVFEMYCAQYDNGTGSSTHQTRPGDALKRAKFYDLWNKHCADIVNARWKGDFAVCDVCKGHAQVDHNPDVGRTEKKENRIQWRQHLAIVSACRLDYAQRRERAIAMPNEYLSIIVDGCDSKNTLLPNIQAKSKSEDKMKEAFIDHKLMGVRVHALRKRDYVYLEAPWAGSTQGGSNLTIEAIARTLHHEAEYRIQHGLRWPSKLYVQLDNTSKDNKNQYVFGYLSYLVQSGVFREVDVNFLPVGHTHEDIDQFFSVLTRRLRFHDAYTFPQWRNEVLQAYAKPEDKVYKVEYITARYDFKKWLEDFTTLAYNDFRSHVFHFRLYKDQIGAGTVRCKYLQYSYHEHKYNTPYMPYNDPPQSWLRSAVVGTPEYDENAGVWSEKIDDATKPVDISDVISKITELFNMQTNAATNSDIHFWTSMLRNTVNKGSNVAAQAGDSWQYGSPNCDLVNERAGFEAYDPRDLQNVEPPGPPLFDLLPFTGMSKTQRNALRDLASQAVQGFAHLDVHIGDFVVFLVDENWASLSTEQSNLPAAATSLPFALGKVVKPPTSSIHQADNDADNKEDASEDEGEAEEEEELGENDPWVIIYYQPDGDPNGTWRQWTHIGTKSAPWKKQIPLDSIVATGFKFCKSASSFSRQFTSRDKKLIGYIPRFPWGYASGKDGGLFPNDRVTEILRARVDNIINTTSVQGSRAHSAAVRELEQHLRKLDILQRVSEQQARIIAEEQARHA
jgi:hypothetical protein